MEEINYSNIIDSRKVLPKLIELLIPIYVNDYGEANRKMIADRLNNMVFIPDSNPIDTADFIANNTNNISNIRYMKRGVSEYKDYCRVSNKYDKKISHMLESFVYNHFDREVISNDDISIMDLDFDAYSFATVRKMNECDLATRREIIARQHKYKADCYILGIDPITNIYHIEDILRYKKDLLKYKNEQLVKETKWGKRIKKELKSIYHFTPNDIDLADVLFDEGTAATTAVIKNSDGDSRCVVHVPMAAHAEYGIDRILLHELRHAVESGETHTGIYDFNKKKYDYINEVRTEANALEDINKLGHDTVFFSKNSKKKSLYEMLLIECEGLVCLCKETFDQMSFLGEVEILEGMMDQAFLDNMEKKLQDKAKTGQYGSKVKVKK